MLNFKNLCFIFLSALLPTFAFAVGSISGTATSASKQTIPNAQVNLYQEQILVQSTTADKDGHYSLSPITAGNYFIQASADDSTTSIQGVQVDNEATTVDFTLQSHPGKITGKVTGAATSDEEIITGVHIKVMLNCIIIGTATTDKNGEYTVSGLPEGTYNVQGEKEDYQAEILGATVSSDHTTTLDFILASSPGEIKGTVVDNATCKPISGSMIQVQKNNVIIGSALTDDTGSYTISNLPTGSYDVTATANNYIQFLSGAFVELDSTTTTNFSLELGSGGVSGKITDKKSNLALVGAVIEIKEGTIILMIGLTNSLGEYTLKGLAEGSYTIEATAKNYAPLIIGVEVSSDTTTTVDLPLEPAFVISNSPLSYLQSIEKNISSPPTHKKVTEIQPSKSLHLLEKQSLQNSKVVANEKKSSNNLSVQLGADPGILRGKVIDSISTLPIEGAYIQVAKNNIIVQTTTTDSSGDYHVTGLQPGVYKINASATGNDHQLLGATIVSNTTTTLNFSLSEGGDIVAYVLDNANGNPLSAIVAVWVQGNLIAEQPTDSEGMIVFTGLAPITYGLIAKSSGYGQETLGAKVAVDTAVEVVFRLKGPSGSIIGKISNATGTGIEGASVEYKENQTTIAVTVTDSTGFYSFTGVSPGSYSVTASADTYQTNSSGAEVKDATPTSVNITLQDSPGTITGEVKDSTTADIAGATIKAMQKNIVIGSAVTDDTGTYTIEGLIAGSYTVVASAENYEHSALGAIVTSNTITVLDFTLDLDPGSITGKITNADGNIAGASVQIKQDSTIIATVITDNSGNYSIDNIAPGSYIVTATAQNYSAKSVGAIINPNATTIVNITLGTATGTISGKITDENGVPLQGATVTYTEPNILIGTTLTDDSGNYSFTGVFPNSYKVAASLDGYDPNNVGVIVQSGQTSTANITLTLSTTVLIGQVLEFGTTGTPIAGALVEVSRNNITVDAILTDDSGNYEFIGLIPNSYVVLVSAEGYQPEKTGSQIIQNTITTTNFTLKSDPGSISGKIISKKTGNSIPGANINVLFNDKIISSTLTDTNGDYSITDLAPNTYTLTAIAQNYQSATVGANVTENVTTTINLSLAQDPGSISGVVKALDTGIVLSGATVIISLTHGHSLTTLTDNSGRYLFNNLAAGTYNMSASDEGYQTTLLQTTVKSEQNSILNFNLPSDAGGLSGIVIDSSTSDPIPSALVKIADGNIIIASGFTDPSGDYIITGIAPGSYIAVAGAQGYEHVLNNITIIDDTIAISNFELSTGTSIVSGNITDIVTGLPIAGAIVEIFDQNGTYIESIFTQHDGFYSLRGLFVGSFTITSAKNGYVPKNSSLFAITSTGETLTENLALFPNSPPTNFRGSVVDIRFLLQSDRIHKLEWDPSTSPEVVEYRVYRDGVLMKIIEAGTSPLEFEDHNRSASKLELYTVIAINSNGSENSEVSIYLK